MILSCLSIIYHSNFLMVLIDILLHVANAMVGSRSWIGGLFHRTSTKRNDKFVDYTLTPVEVKWKLMICWISVIFSECFSFSLSRVFRSGELKLFLWLFQEERLQRLQERLQVPYDETRPEHQVHLFFVNLCCLFISQYFSN